jgi:AraC-like DNA-binding protein
VIIINIGQAKLHPPVRSRAELFDVAEIATFMDATYGVRMRLEEARPHSASLTHARVDIGAVAVDDIALPGELHAEPDPLNKVVAFWAHDGKVSSQCDGLSGEAVEGEVTVLAQPDLPYSAHFVDVNSTTMLLDADLIADVAGATTDGEAPVIRFSSFRPADEAAARLWTDTVSYVKDCVLADDAATPLVLGHCSRLLATVTLATFPNTIAPKPRPYDRTDSGPVLLRRALSYIESNAANDIALADIARAVHVTPRAVQYMFRRHLDCTPLQYLRNLRLDLAHRDLVAAQRHDETVTQIAARWGFVHTGRFAVLYRRTFGQSPHETLRT